MIDIGFTGTHHGMTPQQKDQVCQILKKYDQIRFHHGDCIGADAEAHEIAKGLNILIVLHPPDDPSKRAFCEGGYFSHKPAPYLQRNKHIAKSCQILIAAPKTSHEILRSGTWATVRYARSQSKSVYLIYPNGQTFIESHTYD